MKEITECNNLLDVRAAIDELDQNIVKLIGKRSQYVKAAAKFKNNEDAVKAPDRVKSMLLQRREWARAEGLNPDIIETIYIDLVNSFINEELNRLNTKAKG